jgi:hypothetical protein
LLLNMDDMYIRKALQFVIAMVAGLYLSDYLPIFGDTPTGLAMSSGMICLEANVLLTMILRTN